MRVEILSLDGCPNYDVALERLQEALELEQVTADVMDVLVADRVAAVTLRFLGSPTVRVNGIDVDPSARASRQFGFMCRTYQTEHGAEGAPSLDTIRSALIDAKCDTPRQ